MSWSQKERAKIIANAYKLWNLDGKKVLDVGCGNGVVSKILIERLKVDLIGTDIIDYILEEIPFKKMESNTKLPFDDNSFDYVMFNDILHHTDNIEEVLIEGSRVAKNILIFEDCPGLLIKIIDTLLNQVYCSKMPCPLNFKGEEEWKVLFARLGFEAETGKIVYPFWYPLRHMVFRLRGDKK